MDSNQEFKQPQINIGDWFLTILILSILLVGSILAVWAVDNQNNPSESNWDKVKLIGYLVCFGTFFEF